MTQEKFKQASKRMNHRFFRDAERLCWWCNANRVDVISVTFVPQGGWCVFFKEKED